MQMLAVAADIMQPEAKIAISDHLGTVMELTQSAGLRQLPVVGAGRPTRGILGRIGRHPRVPRIAQELRRDRTAVHPRLSPLVTRQS